MGGPGCRVGYAQRVPKRWNETIEEHRRAVREAVLEMTPDCVTCTGETMREVGGDVGPDELAGFCLHALAGAGDLPSEAAVRRLVAVVLAGLRPQV